MFNREMFKENAKTMLRRFYGKALLPMFIIGVLNLLIVIISFDYNIVDFFKTYSLMIQASLDGNYDSVAGYGMVLLDTRLPSWIIALMDVVNLAFNLLVVPVLTIGVSRFFLRARENPARVRDMFYPFGKNYGNNLGTMLAMMFFLFLWIIVPLLITIGVVVILVIILRLLSDGYFNSPLYKAADVILYIGFFAAYFAALIPALIKSYQYSMLPWIMAENPRMTYKRAFELTKLMTKGYKWKLFVLDLSFIGWIYLSMLIPFGPYFLSPYIYATKAEAYTFLKARVLESGKASAEDFPGLRDDIPAAAATAETAAVLPAAVTAVVPAEEITVIPTAEAVVVTDDAVSAEAETEAASVEITAEPSCDQPSAE